LSTRRVSFDLLANCFLSASQRRICLLAAISRASNYIPDFLLPSNKNLIFCLPAVRILLCSEAASS
ncbi:MAG: hypothetical protein Q7T70_16400, partial [Polaromonas sp.]|nr:hypothetical protein [Polaromonas sp.]